MTDKALLLEQSGLSLLMPGAKNALKTGLGLTGGEKVTLIFDKASQKPAAALLAALEEIEAQTQVFLLENHSVRPATVLPPAIAKALTESEASIYTVHGQEGEQALRIEIITHLVPKHGIKHAHMINLTEDIMMQGLLSDFQQVDRLNRVMMEKLQSASAVRLLGRNGTELTITFSPAEPWHASAGVIPPGEWRNLPDGEILTCPDTVDGVFYCDSLVPDFLTFDRFHLGRKPLKIEIKDGKMVDISEGPGVLAEECKRLLSKGLHQDRVGMLGVGTNHGLLLPIGDLLQDMFMPGGYLGFGRFESADGSPANWLSEKQYLFLARSSTLEVDGQVLIRDSKYEPDILAEATR